MQKYIDAHCHISDSMYLTEVGAIFNAAKPSDWATVSKISDKEKNIYGAIGVHPWYISDLSVGWQSELSDLLKQNPELMVGEIGLDKFHNDMSRQMDVFIAQLNIACALNRGVCVHCVGAYDKLQHIMKGTRSVLPRFLLLHGYSGGVQDIKKMAEKYNVYFSYGARNLRNANRILATPLDRILAETDDDTPTEIINVVNRIAGILNIAPDKMADIIYKNTIRMLNS